MDLELSVPPATIHERVAWILMAAALLFLYHYHLVPAFASGMAVYVVLHRMARGLSGRFVSHGVAKYLAAGLIVSAVLALGVLVVAMMLAFTRGHIGGLPVMFIKMAEIVEQLRQQLDRAGISSDVLAPFGNALELQGFISRWLREHARELTRAGGEAGLLGVHMVMGMAVAVLVAFRQGPDSGRPLAAALSGRIERFARVFESVVLAQVEISAINTALTGVYLFGLLPLLNSKIPFSGTLIAVTFIAGLIPVVGNLISNTAIVLLSLSVSPWISLLSLAFLVGVHKLEYFINARIVGSRIGAAAWEILLAILAFEVAFGIAGVVLAPLIYAYVKAELAERALI